MKVLFKATSALLDEMRYDLSRPHPFAFERVGFISIGATSTPRTLVLIAQEYHRVRDEDYIRDDTVGAMMSQEAIRRALEIALLNPVGIFHVHLHGHAGRPWFSRTDLKEQLKFVPDFFKVRAQMPHGAVVLSRDAAAGRVWTRSTNPTIISEFVTVGPRLRTDTGGSGGQFDLLA